MSYQKNYVWQRSAGNDHQRNNFCMLDIQPSGIKLGQFSRESATHLTTQLSIGGHKGLSWVLWFGGQAGGLEKQAIMIPQNYSSKEGDRTVDFSKQPGTAARNILQNPYRKQKKRLAKRRLKIPAVKQNFTCWNYSMTAVPRLVVIRA